MTVLGLDRRVLVLALARMADSVGNSFLIVVLPLYIGSQVVTGTTFGLTESLITGVILSMFGLLNSLGQPFTGRLSDRLGKRRVFVLIGLAILAVTDAAYAFATSYPTLIGIRAIQGIGVAFTIPATIALVNELATTETRGGNMGLFNTFRLIGFGTGPVVAGLVVDAGPYQFGGFGLSGFDAAFYIASASAIVSFVLVTLLVRDPERTQAAAGDEVSVSITDPADEHLLDPVFTLGVASLFMAIGIALLSTIEPLVNEHLGQGPTMFGIEFGAFIGAQVLLQTPIGSWSDRYGRKPFIVWGLVLLVPATFAQGLVFAPWQMVVARFVQGIAGAMVFAPALALAGDIAKQGQSGTQLSVLTMSFGLGTALGPLSSGILIRYSYVVPFAFGSVLAAVGAVLVYTQVEDTVTGSAAESAGASSPTTE
ncbi:MAG: MFS transporter [Haloarculaceae archaeon]